MNRSTKRAPHILTISQSQKTLNVTYHLFWKIDRFFAVLQCKRLCSTSQWFYHCRADQGLVVYAQKNFQKYFFILKVEPSGSCRWSNWWNILWPSGDMNFPLHFAHICYFAYFPLHFAYICYSINPSPWINVRTFSFTKINEHQLNLV